MDYSNFELQFPDFLWCISTWNNTFPFVASSTATLYLCAVLESHSSWEAWCESTLQFDITGIGRIKSLCEVSKAGLPVGYTDAFFIECVRHVHCVNFQSHAKWARNLSARRPKVLLQWTVFKNSCFRIFSMSVEVFRWIDTLACCVDRVGLLPAYLPFPACCQSYSSGRKHIGIHTP